MQTVSRPIGWTYEVDPYTGWAVSVLPGTGYAPVAPFRFDAVSHVLPWNPYSYPSVGREPGAFPPPDVPAVPSGATPTGNMVAGPRKAEMGGRRRRPDHKAA